MAAEITNMEIDTIDYFLVNFNDEYTNYIEHLMMIYYSDPPTDHFKDQVTLELLEHLPVIKELVEERKEQDKNEARENTASFINELKRLLKIHGDITISSLIALMESKNGG